MGNYPDSIMTCLKETIKLVFWTKRDLRRLLEASGLKANFINSFDWNDYEIKIIEPTIDKLNQKQERKIVLDEIIKHTISYTDCSHLCRFNDGVQLQKDAENSLKKLKELIHEYNLNLKLNEEQKTEYKQNIQQAEIRLVLTNKLDELKNTFFELSKTQEFQSRGHALETLLYELFILHDLNPKSSFKRVGEQIDGAFNLNNQHFLVEVKWQKQDRVNLGCLRDLDGAVSSSLDNTLGLFISIHGFSSEAIDSYTQGKRPQLVCMDGSDLMTVLNGYMDFKDLLSRKIDLAVHKRKIYVSATDIISGKVE